MRKFKVDRKIYAVTKGAHIGEHLLLIEHDSSTGQFLSMPDLKIRTITQKDFAEGVNLGVLDLVEVLPKVVMKACVAQYNIAKNKS